MQDSDTIINKYRPRTLSQVLGQDSIVSSIENLFSRNRVPHCFLFEGNTGVGKTTLSRIIGSMVDGEIIEIDGATHSGVDDMREIANGLKYKSMVSNSGNKCLIMDECQHLSPVAWSSWLKITEEPPDHLYFCFCTTESKKVPAALRTRSHGYKLKDVESTTLQMLVEFVSEQETGVKLDQELIKLIIQESNGSPRLALTYLSEVIGCKTYMEAVDLLRSSQKRVEVIDLCRLLIESRKGEVSQNAIKAINILSVLKELNPESTRIQIMKYFDACVLKARNTNDLVFFLGVLEVFNKDYTPSTGFSNLMLSVFEIIFQRGQKK